MRIVRKHHKVIVQGITGKQGTFWTERMQEYGTNVIGGVNPNKAGTEHCGVPVYGSAIEAASDGGVLPAMVCEVGKRDARGRRLLSLYLSSLDTLLPVTTAMPPLSVGAAVAVRVFVRGRGGELPRRIGVQLEVEGLAGRDVFECQATDLVEGACEGGLVEEGGDRR